MGRAFGAGRAGAGRSGQRPGARHHFGIGQRSTFAWAFRDRADRGSAWGLGVWAGPGRRARRLFAIRFRRARHRAASGPGLPGRPSGRAAFRRAAAFIRPPGACIPFRHAGPLRRLPRQYRSLRYCSCRIVGIPGSAGPISFRSALAIAGPGIRSCRLPGCSGMRRASDCFASPHNRPGCFRWHIPPANSLPAGPIYNVGFGR